MPAPDAFASALILGGGQAGFQTSASLRDGGFGGTVTIVGDEPGLPYQRPPLSKAYLTGGAEGRPVPVTLRPREFFDRHAVELVGERATAIDREGRRLVLASGRAIGFDHLVLATGARPRPLPVPGAELERVFQLRTLADADALREVLAQGVRLVVVGGGFVGMEVAASARKLDVEVTVVEALDRVLARVAAPEISAHVTDVHAERGVEVLVRRTVRALHGVGGSVREVELGDGSRLSADVVVLGIGVMPNTELAERAGLAVANGVVVDERLLTADPRISAIGDCASYPSPFAGDRTRLESVQNAVDQARYVAARLTGAAPGPYREVPWFWTHQFDLRIQTAGIGREDDRRVVQGDPATGGFSVLRFQGERLVCVESVNRTADHIAARKILGEGRPLDPATVMSTGFELKAFAAAG
jgi:3-phenylpropionate/trans-cinnamate dioxygenase ferredoxin reductase component